MNDKLIHPEPLKLTADETESFDNWGFRDTRFAINENGVATILGDRYELSGKELTRLLPWIRETLEIELDPKDVHQTSYPTEIHALVENSAFKAELQTFIGDSQIDTGGEVRLRHGHGHTQEEMFAIKHKRLGRIPDMVIYPESESQVAQLIEAAKKHNVVLIPFGGGTNVTDALRCSDDEKRVIVSVDMRRMNRVRWIDPENMMACIEAGAVGRHIIEE